jgi:uncharacterized membrane protein
MMVQSSSGDPVAADPERIPVRDASPRWVRVALFAAISAYFVVSLVLSELRALELNAQAYDLGIYQQSLWSSLHGRVLYEAPDYETAGYASLLIVHTGFILFAIAPLYNLYPNPLTLFVVQSAAVGLAALPLFWLTRFLSRSSWTALGVALLYLAWAPTLSSNLYDFHLEAFLPLELFTFFGLWISGRWALGGAAAALSFLTLEVAPVFVFFAGLFFLSLLTPSETDASRPPSPWVSPRNRVRATLSRIGRGFRASSATIPTLALCLGSLGAYYALRWFQTVGIERWLGLAAIPSSFVPPAYGGVIGGTPTALGLSYSNLFAFLPDKLSYWIVAYALVAFLPWWALRTQILAVPWWLFTFFAGRLTFVQLGYQYGLLAAFPVFVGVAYGAVAVRRIWTSSDLASARYPSDSLEGVAARSIRERERPAGVRSRRAGLVLALGFLLALNVALTPIDPLLQNQWELGQGYDVRYAIPIGYGDALRVASLVPADATVVASDRLFPLVADNVHAYDLMSWTRVYLYNFPFGPGHLPPYLLLSEVELGSVPPWIATALYNRSDYGLRAVAWSAPIGPVMLFALGYGGPVAEFALPPVGPLTFGPGGLAAGTAGQIEGGGPPPFGTFIGGAPGFLGTVWGGPSFALAPGRYSVQAYVRVVAAYVGSPPAASTPVATLQSGAFGLPLWFNRTYTYAELATSGWTTVLFSLTVTVPVFLVQFAGYQLSDTASVQIGQLAILPASGGA